MFDATPAEGASPTKGAVHGFLDDMEPGILLAAALSEIDVAKLDGADRVVVLRAHDRMTSYHAAQRSRALASLAFVEEFDGLGIEDTFDAAAAEARVALHLTRRSADVELNTALDLHDRLPQLWEAWSRGVLDARRVQVVLRGTAHLDVGEARSIAGRVLCDAPTLTTGQLHARLARLSMEADPAAAKRRFDDALADRRISLEATEVGTANLFALDLSPARIGGVHRRINRCALALKRTGDARTMDQLRADVFLDLLEGAQPSKGGGSVDLRVDLATLAELSDEPGELAGFGPVIADIARQVAADQAATTWRYAVTDAHGAVSAVGVTRRRPRASDARTVTARRPTCVFPGCRMPASECDLDHRIPWSRGGPTSPANLEPLCRHDHRIRHLPGWSYRPGPDGRPQWNTALGQTRLASVAPP